MQKSKPPVRIFLPVMISLLLILMGSFGAHAQKDFEGYIVYVATEPTHQWDDFDSLYGKTSRKSEMVRVFFSPGKMLIRTNKINGEAGSDVLIFPDSGKVYDLDASDSTYREKKMRVRINRPARPERIAGHAATPIIQDLPGSMMEGPSTFWFADSLFFHVPEKYAGNEELIMVNKNRILLKAVMTPGYGYDHESGETDAASLEEYALVLEATEIVRTKNDPALFTIPPYFKPAPAPEYNTDSVVVMTDTSAMYPAETPTDLREIPPREKSPKKPVKKTNIPKEAAKKEDEKH